SRAQSLYGALVLSEMLRLPPYRLLPAQSEPGEIVKYSGFEFRAAAPPVDVLDAHQESATRRGLCRINRRIGMPQVQQTGGARCKSGNGRSARSCHEMVIQRLERIGLRLPY